MPEYKGYVVDHRSYRRHVKRDEMESEKMRKNLIAYSLSEDTMIHIEYKRDEHLKLKNS